MMIFHWWRYCVMILIIEYDRIDVLMHWWSLYWLLWYGIVLTLFNDMIIVIIQWWCHDEWLMIADWILLMIQLILMKNSGSIIIIIDRYCAWRGINQLLWPCKLYIDIIDDIMKCDMMTSIIDYDMMKPVTMAVCSSDSDYYLLSVIWIIVDDIDQLLKADDEEGREGVLILMADVVILKNCYCYCYWWIIYYYYWLMTWMYSMMMVLILLM